MSTAISHTCPICCGTGAASIRLETPRACGENIFVITLCACLAGQSARKRIEARTRAECAQAAIAALYQTEEGHAVRGLMDGATPGPLEYCPYRQDDCGTVKSGVFVFCRARDPRTLDDETFCAYREGKKDPFGWSRPPDRRSPDLAALASREATPAAQDDAERLTIAQNALIWVRDNGDCRGEAVTVIDAALRALGGRK